MTDDLPDLPCDWSLLGDAPLAVAVSGGADSFALLRACAERGLPVVALTVDHGLREGAPEDARVVADWCRARRIPHETLVWTGDKPRAGIQAAARTARYRLLCEACERLGLDRLATGHTLDDQAETVFMRLRRGAGRGLAGMPPSRRIASGPGEPVTLLRPMLGTRRAEARAYAEAAGLPVRDDPSNEDEGFERVRVRALLGALEEQGLLGAEALGRTAELERVLVSAYDVDYGDRDTFLFAVSNGPHHAGTDAERFPANLFDVELGTLRGYFSESERDLALRFVDAIGSAHGGDPDLPIHGEVCTTSGVVIDGTRSSGPSLTNVLIYREPAALLGRADGTPGLAPVPTPPGSRHLYDRRFIVSVPGDVPPGTELRPLGQLLPRDLATSTLARSRVATLPCLCVGERVTHLPAAAIRAVREAFSGWQRAGEVLPSSLETFEARSLLAERFANDVIRY